ncbi:MAG: sulfur oxidation c-type cytochrome SoxX [Betaproteobacteria bacterium]|nr:sulfur oxidation c-type cytochrome SoxX [Betaproteobacteria bacterium]MDH5580063.1 sulfur oxidation c-type cytochrome SoxX [Betaproteobacteria bacterium]
MKIGTAVILAAATAILAACAALQSSPRDEALALMQRDFHAQGIAGMDRLKEDPVQAACNKYNDNPPADLAKKLQGEQYAGVKWPADGKLLGDWKSGEKIAQNGRGMAWSDKGGVGGSCYNCHQIDPATTAFGTIGPSLSQFAKLRGYGTDIQRYAYSKIYNAKAYSICSQMPRFGHAGALTEQQMKDITALLMDPASPVNR